jgi:predicted Zn-dependent peptidase
VSVHGKYTELLAVINPQHIKSFFQIVSENDFSVDNLEVIKKQMIVNSRLIHSCFQNAFSNEISANIKYKNLNIDNVMNEKVFLSISKDDVEKYFEQHYEKCHMSIVVVGAIGHKSLIKSFQSTLCALGARQPLMPGGHCTNQIFKHIHMENKYVVPLVQYFYKIPGEDLASADSFFQIFNHEAFKFFEKTNSMILGYKCLEVVTDGDRVQQVILLPKFNVSLVDLQKAYDVFVDRICKQEISAAVLAKIKLISGYAEQFLSSDLPSTYSKIKNNYLSRLDARTAINSPSLFNSLGEKILKRNLILKITTRHKPDK